VKLLLESNFQPQFTEILHFVPFPQMSARSRAQELSSNIFAFFEWRQFTAGAPNHDCPRSLQSNLVSCIIHIQWPILCLHTQMAEAPLHKTVRNNVSMTFSRLRWSYRDVAEFSRNVVAFSPKQGRLLSNELSRAISRQRHRRH